MQSTDGFEIYKILRSNNSNKGNLLLRRVSVIRVDTFRNFFLKKSEKLFGGFIYFTYICNINSKVSKVMDLARITKDVQLSEDKNFAVGKYALYNNTKYAQLYYLSDIMKDKDGNQSGSCCKEVDMTTLQLSDKETTLSNGDTDNFQSYEEGIKDALEWVYFGGNRPIVKED